MKPFNVFLTISLIIIFAGFFFFRNGFRLMVLDQSDTTPSTALMDRLSYLNYSDQNLATSKSFGNTALFFAATTWCQTCSVLDKEIKERISDIPSNVTILKVDYDNDKEMKNKHKVTTQHTIVVLDKGGREVKRWIGGNFDLLLQEVKEI